MKYLVLIAVLVVVSLAVVGLMTASTPARLTDREAEELTALALRQMKFNSEVYRDADDRVRGDTLLQLVDTLQSLGGEFAPESELLLRTTRDGWGRELILEKRSESTWMLRSRGPNGVDDQGEGDDLEVDLHPTPRPEPTGDCNCGEDDETAPAPSPAIEPKQQPTPAKREP
ncbi:hypothetical protein [Blastopirellula retiformator]|uniref:Uncharacterized protein n=1 Tax=Blastopirellula retiformator TaxID=2527970 RepID=A0A5C5VJK8_9BACT|nr:hypothetical protein [Blastopirellula retiformator]TWT38784.1 hypothetical protein Enr8_04780 [Blastopirellula retiformator]